MTTIKQLKEELDKWPDNYLVELYEDEEKQGLEITAPGRSKPEAVVKV